MAVMLERTIRGLLALCFLAVFAAGLAGCGGVAAVAGAEKPAAGAAEPAANYPDVWERVLPEEVRTNIANYRPYGLEGSKLIDKYAASVVWHLHEVYHIDGAGEENDDVILCFSDSLYNFVEADAVFYYSFFDGNLPGRGDGRKFSYASDMCGVTSTAAGVRKLPFISPLFANDDEIELHKKWGSAGNYIYSLRVTLSNGVIYDATPKAREYYEARPFRQLDWCSDSPTWGEHESVHDATLLDKLTSYKSGESFLPAKHTAEDASLKNTRLLLQGFDEPRYVSKECLIMAVIRPTFLYNYHEYSALRVSDRVVPLPDGTFLFVGTANDFPVFHIIRMRPDMSIPAELSRRYKWVSYKDYVGIVNLYSKGLLFAGRGKECPALIASHSPCVESADAENSCVNVRGGRAHYHGRDLDNEQPIEIIPNTPGRSVGYECLYAGLRDYVRGEFEIYHCREGEGDETVAGFAPCGEKAEE